MSDYISCHLTGPYVVTLLCDGSYCYVYWNGKRVEDFSELSIHVKDGVCRGDDIRLVFNGWPLSDKDHKPCGL